jgi:hypothetical protein
VRVLNQSLLLAGFFSPAAISLYFAWSAWIGNDRPAIALWRLVAFRCGLISAAIAMAIFIPSCWYMLQSLEAARGIVLLANWVSVALWGIGLTTSLAGKGWARLTLALWGVLMILGLMGIVSARIVY